MKENKSQLVVRLQSVYFTQDFSLYNSRNDFFLNEVQKFLFFSTFYFVCNPAVFMILSRESQPHSKLLNADGFPKDWKSNGAEPKVDTVR